MANKYDKILGEYREADSADVSSKEDVANKSTNVVTDGASNTKYPSVKAIKDYADGLLAGLLDYRGAYNASGNTYPTTGGSGTGGAIVKGDMFVISVAGTLGSVAIQIGDFIIANLDTPGQTAANWDTLNTNIAFAPEDSANKVTSISSGSTDTQYPSAKLLYDTLLGYLTASNTATLTNKRITKRVVTTTDDSTAVIDVDVTDVYELSAMANATTFTLTGTPTDGQTILIRFKDNGTTRALTWTGFTIIGTTLPTTTIVSKWHYVGIQYNSAASQWHVIAVSVQA